MAVYGRCVCCSRCDASLNIDDLLRPVDLSEARLDVAGRMDCLTESRRLRDGAVHGGDGACLATTSGFGSQLLALLTTGGGGGIKVDCSITGGVGVLGACDDSLAVRL